MAEEKYNWYIVHVSPGYEKKVVESIKAQAEKEDILSSFEQINIPTEEIVEIRRGKKINSEKKVLPGYILIKMIMNDVTWHLVKNTKKVTGFLGANSKPQIVPEIEVQRVLQQIQENTVTSKFSVNFEVGETVKIIDGPFESFNGVVEEIDEEKSRLKISVSIFGRSTPLILEYVQVTKL